LRGIRTGLFGPNAALAKAFGAVTGNPASPLIFHANLKSRRAAESTGLAR